MSPESRESIRSHCVLYQDRIDTLKAMLSNVSPCQQNKNRFVCLFTFFIRNKLGLSQMLSFCLKFEHFLSTFNANRHTISERYCCDVVATFAVYSISINRRFNAICRLRCLVLFWNMISIFKDSRYHLIITACCSSIFTHLQNRVEEYIFDYSFAFWMPIQQKVAF